MPFSQLIEVTNSPEIVTPELLKQMLKENANRLSSTQHPFIQTTIGVLDENGFDEGDVDIYLVLVVTRQIPLVTYVDDKPVVAVASCIFNMYADGVYDHDEGKYTSVLADRELLLGSDYMTNQSDQEDILTIDFKINDTIQTDQEVINQLKNLLLTSDDEAYINGLLEKKFIVAPEQEAYYVEAIHKINGEQFSHYYKVYSPKKLESEDEALYKSLAYSGLYGIAQDFNEGFDHKKQVFTKDFDDLTLSDSRMVDWDDGFSLVRLVVEPFDDNKHVGDDLWEHHLQVNKNASIGTGSNQATYSMS